MFVPEINLFIGANDNIKSNKAINKIDGPDAVFKLNEENNPANTDITPPHIDIITI